MCFFVSVFQQLWLINHSLAAAHPPDFDRYPEPQHDDHNNLSTKDPLIVLSLSHVDRRWRSIALALPVLWSTFVMHSTPGVHTGDQKQTYAVPNAEWRQMYLFMTRGASALKPSFSSNRALLDMFLERSANHPLSVRILCPGRSFAQGFNDSPTLPEHEMAVIVKLAPNLPRMRYLFAPKPFWNALYRQASPEFLPSVLRSFGITHTDDRFPAQFGLALDHITQSLVSLRCSSKDLGRIMTSGLIFPAIRRITIDPHQEHHRYLRLIPGIFPGLQALLLPSMVIQGPREHDGGMYHMSKLRVLHFDNIVPMSACWRVLYSFHVPDLTHLHLSCQMNVTNHRQTNLLRPPESHIPRLILRSQCQLQCLSLRLSSVPPVELVEILLLTPQLKTFHYVGFADHRRFNTVTNSFVKALLDKTNSVDGTFTVIPNLRILKLQGSFQCNPALLAQLVQQRQRLAKPRRPVGFMDVDGDDRHLEEFVLTWQGPDLDPAVIREFASASQTGQVEVWQRDDHFRGYSLEDNAKVATLRSSAIRDDEPNPLLLRGRQLIEISNLREEIDTSDQSSPEATLASEQLQHKMEVLHGLPQVPACEIQETPFLHTNDSEDYDDSFHEVGPK